MKDVLHRILLIKKHRHSLYARNALKHGQLNKAEAADWEPQVPGYLQHPFTKIVQATSDPHFLLDGTVAPAALLPPRACMSSAAIISAVSINRRGGFSCPVRTAAILTHLILPSDSSEVSSNAADCATSQHKQAAKAVMHLTNDKGWAEQLVSCHSYESLLDAVARGKLPPVACARIVKPADDFVGCVVEFEVPDASKTEVKDHHFLLMCMGAMTASLPVIT